VQKVAVLVVSVAVNQLSLKMGTADGLKLNSLFGVTESAMDNNLFIPLTGMMTPYGTALGIYLIGVAGKMMTLCEEVNNFD
jgi:filamentous hemagglutinin